MSEQSSVLQHWAERAFKAEAEIKRLRRERNLAVEMLQSAERELAAERERCAKERWKVDDSGIELSHAELCTLSREFNERAHLADPHHYRINEWLKRQIAAIRKGEP